MDKSKKYLIGEIWLPDEVRHLRKKISKNTEQEKFSEFIFKFCLEKKLILYTGLLKK